jgi:hypothetical protein
MAVLANDQRQIAFYFTITFVILGAILLAVSLYDPSTTADRTAMGCFGIAFTALAILLLAAMIY